MTVPTEPAQERITRLRSKLMAGRGAGASVGEVDAHTHDRPVLRAVPDIVAHGWESVSAPALTPAERTQPALSSGERSRESQRAMLLGALAGLAVGLIGSSLTRTLQRTTSHGLGRSR